MATGRIHCPPEHAKECGWLCDQLGGGLSTNPDGSVTCEFKIELPDGTSTGDGSFKVPNERIEVGRAACRQLGGKYMLTEEGATCSFRLPQEARWSTRRISQHSVLVRFDPHVFYILSCEAAAVRLQVFDGGAIAEEFYYGVSVPEYTAVIYVRDREGRDASLHLELTKDLTSLVHCHKGEQAYALKVPPMMFPRAYLERSASGETPRPKTPYLDLFAGALRVEPALRNLAAQACRPPTAQAPNGLVDTFCQDACAICEASHDPWYCLACFGCKIILKTPTGDGPVPV